MNNTNNTMNREQAQAFAASSAFRSVTNWAQESKRAEITRMVKGGAK